MMGKVRVLVGTTKGLFILTSNEKREQWDIDGPHFGGWEIYHLKGTAADPDRLYASQSTGRECAPGQLTPEEMTKLYRLMRITR